MAVAEDNATSRKETTAQGENLQPGQGAQAGSREGSSQVQNTGEGGNQQGSLARRSGFPMLARSPFQLMRQMSEEMDRLFSDVLLGGSGRGQSLTSRGTGNLGQQFWAPQLEVLEQGDQLIVRADLPGLSKEDVQVQVQDGLLTIQGERKQQHEEQRGDFYRSERSYDRFQRSIALPEGINPDEVKGSFKDGVLDITLPMPQAQQQDVRQIELQ